MKKLMKITVEWDGEITMQMTKEFENRWEGYKELSWVFRTAKEKVEGKDNGIDYKELGFTDQRFT